ncbi:MAG: hypothetical protein K8S55_09545, partial [Phycisphaerae bacterium]|nr:hypothetical protein [Phycisphaerae bacterium]
MIVGVILLGGCTPTTMRTSSPGSSPESTSPARLPDGSPSAGPNAKTDSARPARSINMIRLQLVTIEVPTGIASGTEELWSYLDEEPIALRSTVLGLNGFRVGIGRSDSWEDVKRVLKKMTGREQKITNLQIFSGKPNPIVLKTNQPIQTIFTYFEDQSLSGSDYPAGDNILAISCSV